MQSAPNNERLLSFLNERGHSYTNDRSLIEACRDSKTYMALLKDLLDQLEPGFIRSWMATEAYSFSQDVERNRLTLPVLNDYLAHTNVLSQLKMQFRLGMLFSKQAGEKAMPVINRIFSFLQGREKVLQETQTIRVQYQLMFKTYKNINERSVQIANQRRQVMAQKEKERPTYEQHKQQLSELKNKLDEREVEIKKILKEIDYYQSEFKRIQSHKIQIQRSIEQTELKISQYKRQLIQFAPDIKKEKQHLDVKISSKKEILSFKEKLWQHIAESFQTFEKSLNQQKCELEEISEAVTQNYQKYNQIARKSREEEELLAKKGPELIDKQRAIKNLESQITAFQITANNNEIAKDQVSEQIIKQQSLLLNQEKVEKMLNEAENETLNFKASLEVQKQDQLLTASQVLQSHQRSYRQRLQALQLWYNMIEKTINTSKQLFRIGDN